MSKLERKKNAQKKYEALQLCYLVKDAPNHKKNKAVYPEVKKALAAVGVSLTVQDGELSLSILPEAYEKEKSRFAGRRKKHAFCRESGQFEMYRYSDIVAMLQTMTDAQIAEKINMKIATYYRHKKELRESEYYRALDKNRLTDRDYLEGVAGNKGF